MNELKVRGMPPRRITAERFHYLHEVLPPLDVHQWKGEPDPDIYSFRVSESWGDGLYAFVAEVRGTYWHMVVELDTTPLEILELIHAEILHESDAMKRIIKQAREGEIV